jgi:hypothetical protein
VWSGFTKSFTKPSFSNGSLPENQDMLTPNLIFARAANQGLYNAAAEDFYTQQFSPADTGWATALIAENDGLEIEAANWEALTFTNWVDAFGGLGGFGLPTALTTHNAVVYLEYDDVFLDIQFTFWGEQGDGGFSYDRAEPSSSGPSGDYNGDHVVNAADYTVWRNTLGSAATPAGSGADGIPDGTIDDADYEFWKQHFGEVVPGGAGAGGIAAVVPEPSAMLLMLIGLLAATIYRKSTPRGPGQG